jgi:hypothetical protein
MKPLRQLLQLFRDSPTWGRDRASLLSGFSIGTTALLLNAAVLFLILPLMLDPDDRDFREFTANVEFGQLLSLILLGGAAAFATFLIPLRLLSVFWGPRIGRYFDQIVLSGITPLKFVIGKVTSQNLFLALIAFLLLPYLVLSLTLGGVSPVTFLAGLFLLWLYCIQLAVITLWVSLYLNELLAAFVVISCGTLLSVLGCLPLPVQPLVVTPFPALIHPVLRAMPSVADMVTTPYSTTFMLSALCMSVITVVGLVAIHLGPLYGIIRENSTFGEVVRAGDSRRKRWLRIRQHIQRPSELAFFYENRSGQLRNWDGLVRWGCGTTGLIAIVGIVWTTFGFLMTRYLIARGGMTSRWWAEEFHSSVLVIHAIAAALGALLFLHARNTTLLRIPVAWGLCMRVASLDTLAFLFYQTLLTVVAAGLPFWFETAVAIPFQGTVFPDAAQQARSVGVDFRQIALEGNLVITISAVVLYAGARFVCLLTWIRTAAFVGVAGSYMFLVVLLPVVIGAMFAGIPELREMQPFSDWSTSIALCSPITVIMSLFDELWRNFPEQYTTAPFYILHGSLLMAACVAIPWLSRRVEKSYLPDHSQEPAS